VCDRDPERLYWKLQELEKPKEPAFDDIACAWHDQFWHTYKDGTRDAYRAMYERIVSEQTGRKASEISAADISRYLSALASQNMSARSVKALRTLYKLIY
jgi:site-specific recombinase XerD